MPGCLLALVGLIEMARRRNYFWLALIVVTIELSFGRNGHLADLVYRTPLLNLFRHMPTYFDLANFGLCLMAAFGMNALIDPDTRVFYRRWFPGGLVVLLLLGAGWGVFYEFAWKIPGWYHMLAVLALFCVLLLLWGRQQISPKAAHWAVLGLMVFELCHYSMNQVFNWSIENPQTLVSYDFAAHRKESLEFLRADSGGDFRVAAIDDPPWGSNGCLVWRIPCILGWNPLMLQSYREYIRQFIDAENYALPWGETEHRLNSPLLDLLGVRYVLIIDPDAERLQLAELPKFEKVFAGPDWRSIYRNKDYFSRAWFYPRAYALPSTDSVLPLMNSAWFDARRTLLISQTDHPSGGSPNLEPLAVVAIAPDKFSGLPEGKLVVDENCAEVRKFFADWGATGNSIRSDAVVVDQPGNYALLIEYADQYSTPPRIETTIEQTEPNSTSPTAVLPPALLAMSSGWNCNQTRTAELGTVRLDQGKFRLTMKSLQVTPINFYSLWLVRLPADTPPAATDFSLSKFEYAANRLAFHADLPQDGFVLMNEIYYPGWEATVDGQPAEILRGDHIFRTLAVSAGSHQIEMRFRPRYFWLGAAISLLTLGATLGYFVLSRRGWNTAFQNARRAVPLLGVAAVCLWFLYAFHSYMPHLGPTAFRETVSSLSDLLNRWGIPDTIFVAWTWMAAYLLGRKFLDGLGICLVSGIERLWLSSTLGLSVLSLAIFLLAVLHILHRGEAYALLILPVLIWFGEVRRIAAKLWRLRPAAPGPLSVRNLAHCFLVSYIAVVLAVVFLSALGPEIEYDPLSMHLYAARTIAEQHSLKAIPEIPQTFLPKNITMLFSLGWLLHSQMTAKLINYLLGVLALLGTYALAARLFSRTVGLVAVAVLASSPLLMWEMRTAHLDSGFTLFVFLPLFATLLWLESSQPSWFHLAVYATAFSLGTKYQALFPLGALATIVFSHGVMNLRNFFAAGTRTMKFFLFSVIGLLPWGIVNLVQTGNPVFPFFNEVFQSPYWTPELTQRVEVQMRESGIPITFSNGWAVVTDFWHMGVAQIDFHGNIGVFYLILIPLLIFQRRIPTAVKLLLGFSMIYWLLWLFTGQHARYFLGALPGLALAAAYALVGWLEWVRAKVGKPFAVGTASLLALLAVFNSPFFESYGASPRYGSPILESVPGKFLLGQESRDQFLSRSLLDYPVVQYLNQLPGKKKVLFSWDSDPIAYYLNGETAFVYTYYFEQLGGQNPAELSRVLREHGITHVVIGQRSADSLFYSDPEKEFVQRYLKKIYQKNSIILYEVASQALRQEIVSYDFLNHIDDATIEMPAEPSGKPNSAYRGVHRIVQEDRYALETHPPAEVQFGVSLPQHPVMRFAVGRKWPPCEAPGWFQLWIQPADGERQKLFERLVMAQNPIYEVGWFEEEIDLAAYAGQTVRFAFKTELPAGGGCDWFLWADPQIISRP